MKIRRKTPLLARTAAFGLASALALIGQTVRAADVIKANNATALNSTASWVGGVVPTTSDYATFDSTVSGSLSVALGATIDTFGGLKVTNPGGDITITMSSASQRLTLGPAASTTTYTVIDMSTATQNLTLTTGIVRVGTNVSGTAVFNVASGRTLTLPIFQNQTGSRTARFTGGGNVVINGAIGTAGTNLTLSADGANLTLNNTSYDATAARVVSVLNGGSLNVGTDTALTGPTSTQSISLNNGTLTAANGARNLSYNVALAGSGTIGGTNNLTLTGTVSGAGTLAKTGSSVLTLGGVNSYNGATTVSAGTLLVNGFISSSATVNGGIIGGTGTTGSVTVNTAGTLSTGSGGIGTLTTGAVSLSGTSTFAVDINTSAATSDKLLSGSFSLDSANTVKLVLTDLGSNVQMTMGTTLTIVDYSGVWDGHLFTFNGSALADDSIFAFGANNYQISYDGVGGGDSAITLTTVVPEPSTVVLMGIGIAGGLFGLRRRRVA